MEWKAALYGRVSTEHEEQQESIRVQKEALLQYSHEKGFTVAGMYFDEGFSGTDFDRPGINSMKEDIKSNKINLVLVKDLSRLGRNNTQTLLFLDFLCREGVRLIAVNDGYDTLNDEDELVGIKTWINERYSRELSQKIRFAIYHKKKKGEYLGAFAPYGYKKSMTRNNALEIDIYSAGVVKKIFELYIAGNGFMKIAQTLEKMGIPNPSKYGSYAKKSNKWDWTTIKKIITNRVYTGMLIQHRYCRRSFKDRHMLYVPPSQWIYAENTHEAIIDRDTFELAQKILDKRRGQFKYRCGPKEAHLFTSFLFCGECGSPFYYRKTKGNGGTYMCSKYVKYGRSGCTGHFIGEHELADIVDREIKLLISENIDKNRMLSEIYEACINENNIDEKIMLMGRQVLKNQRKIDILYKDRLDGVIDQNAYLKMHDEITLEIYRLNGEMERLVGLKYDENALKTYIENCINMKDGIDRHMLEVLINRIVIYKDGNLTIHYNFTV